MVRKASLFAAVIPAFLLSANVFAMSAFSDVGSLGQYISTSMQDYETPITVSYTVPSDITRTVQRNILTGAYIQDDYTAASYSEISLSETTDKTNPSAVDLTITPEYVETTDQEAYVNQKVADIAASVVQPGMTDYQKVAALHDWVVSHVKYDTTLQEVSDYSALTDGKTVCRGYAMLLYKLLTKAGFSSHIVLGEVSTGFRYRSSAEGHAWNMVQLDGSWYFIDPTNDGLSTDTSTRFFLVSGKVLQQNGFMWDQTKYPSAQNSYGSSTSTTSTASTASTTSTAALAKIRISRLAYSSSPVTLSIAGVSSDGTKAAVSNTQAAWTSSNTNVAAVDSNGVVTFTGNSGKVTIRATVGNISSSVSTNVYYVLGMTRIKYSTTSQTVQMYKVYSDGVLVPVTGVTWASSDTTLATVDTNGNVAFTGTAGRVTISGTYNGTTVSERVSAGAVSSRMMRRGYFRRW